MRHLIGMKLIFALFVSVLAKRLPVNVIPKEYRLQIVTNLDDEADSFHFKGLVSIHIKCVSPTENITLHSKNLKIDEEKTNLRNVNKTEDSVAILETSKDVENDFLILTLSQTLQADLHYEVQLLFEGDLEEEKMGYYRSSYVDIDDQKNWLAVTYFKPDNARRAFPCFDEPAFKASFAISLGRSTKFKSLSNMPLLQTEKMADKSDWEWDHYEATPPMLTYIVAFAIIEFDHREVVDRRGLVKIPFALWGQDRIIYNTAGERALEFSIEYFNTLKRHLDMKYLLPKLNMLTIPGYAVPVMENWGLIIWEERYWQQIARPTIGVDVLGTIADQSVRQVFGNLVAIKSWTDLWYADSFNMYLTAIVADTTMEGYDWLLWEITDNMISVFNFDSLRNSQAVSISSNQSESIGAITDPNARKKNFLLTRMLSHFAGHKNVLKAIQQYLRICEYNNAGSDELLELVNDVASSPDIHVRAVMDDWIWQAGIPLITVTRDYKRGRLEVKQERFFRDSELLGTDTTRWWIPLTYTTECELDFEKTVVRKWLSPNEDLISIKGPASPGDWMIFNIDVTGLYLVNYDEENWTLLANFLNKPFFQQISPLNRALLVNNAAILASVGRLHYRIFLDILKYIVQETQPHPKYAAMRCIDDLNALLKRTPVHERFISYVGRVLLKSFRAAQMSGDRGDYHQQVRHVPQTSGFGQLVAAAFLEDTILCTGDARRSHPYSDYQKWKGITEIKNENLRSLICCQDQKLLQTYLKKSLDEETSGNQDVAPVLAAIAGNKDALEMVTAFLTENIKTIHDRISPNVRQLSPVLIEVARHLVTEDELAWLRNFIDTNQEYFQDVQDGVNQALEIAKLNVQWHHRHYGTFETYFNGISDD